MRLHTDWDTVWNRPAAYSFAGMLCGFFMLYLGNGGSPANRVTFDILAGVFFLIGLITGLFSFLVEARKGAWLRWLALGFAALIVVSVIRGKVRRFGFDEVCPDRSQIAVRPAQQIGKRES